MIELSRSIGVPKVKWLKGDLTTKIDTTAGFPYRHGDYPWLDEIDPLFTPLSLPKFLSDHLGVKLYPKQEEDLLAIVGDDPKKTFDAGVSALPSQGIILYGKGSGKDYIVSCTVIWAIHVLLCLKNPAMYLGQAFGENIDVVTVAYSREQAQSVLFYKIKARLRSCGWMQQALVKWLDRMGINMTPDRYLKEGGGYVGGDSIIFPSNVRLWALPATDAAEGKNPILWVADELSAFASPVRQNQAKHIHSILTTSARTRFQSRFKGFVITYPRHKGDYAMQLYDQAIASPNGDIYAVKRPTWEVNLQSTRESLQPDYDRDPEGSRSKYECDPPAAIDAFFRDPEKLILHASGGDVDFLQQQLPNVPIELLEAIAARGIDPIKKTDQWGDPILDGRGFPTLHSWFRGRKNRSGDDYEYYVHLDPGATGDSFGIVMGHLEDALEGIYPMIDLAFRYHGRMFQNFGIIDRWAWFDGDVKSTENVVACEVDFRTIREFIYFLVKARGFTISRITQDTWNSVDNKQALAKNGFTVATRVVNKEDYDAFKQLVYNRQLAYYAWRSVILEATKLQLHNGTKVDAPRTSIGDDKIDSHKDVTDGIAAVCRQLLLLRDESTTFYQFPPIESILEQAIDRGLPLGLDERSASEAQQRIMEAFFSE
jgi:hypothetical protein